MTTYQREGRVTIGDTDFSGVVDISSGEAMLTELRMFDKERLNFGTEFPIGTAYTLFVKRNGEYITLAEYIEREICECGQPCEDAA